MNESTSRVAALRRALGRLAAPVAAAGDAGHVAIGSEAIDAALDGGLARGRLHELFALDAADAGAAAGFAAMLALRAGGDLLWLRQDQAQRQGGRLHAAGLVELGLDPARVVLILLPDPLAVLRAAIEVARCRSIRVAVIEMWHDPRLLDLTASRRLALAAEQSGIMLLLLRVAAEPSPSAADTRWSVRSAESTALAANAPGPPAFMLELLRRRGGGAGGCWRVEWDRDRHCFTGPDAGRPALPGAVVSLSAGGPAGARTIEPSERQRRSA